jgi:hypothetical protein
MHPPPRLAVTAVPGTSLGGPCEQAAAGIGVKLQSGALILARIADGPNGDRGERLRAG